MRRVWGPANGRLERLQKQMAVACSCESCLRKACGGFRARQTAGLASRVSCPSSRTCRFASPKRCPSSSRGGCLRTPAGNYSDRGRCRRHPSLPAAGAGAPKNACLPFRDHSRRHVAAPPQSTTWGSLHSTSRATLEAGSARHRHGGQKGFPHRL